MGLSEIVEQRLTGLLRKRLKFLSQGQTFDADAELGDLGLDSMAAIELLLDLEQNFEVVFPDALLVEETFRTRRALTRVIVSMIEQRGYGAGHG